MTDTTFKSRFLSGAALASVLVLSGCSSVPDAINPVEWYKSTVDLFDAEDEGASNAPSENKGLSGDSEGREQAEAKAKEFPKVADVPATQGASSAEALAAARGGLVADREQRRYASAPIQRQSEDGDSPMVAGTQPPPPAMPAAAVTPTPIAKAAAMSPKPVTRMASAPPLAATTVQETYRNKLAQKFKAAAAAAPPSDSSTLPVRPRYNANAAMPRVSDPLGTVVISSDGVLSQGSRPSGDQPTYVTATGDTGASSQAAMSRQSYPAGGSARVATILFSNGTAKLSVADMKILRQVSSILKDRGGRLRIVGHASSRTRDMDLVRHKMTNFQVSADRADTVAKALLKIGVASELISVVARSDSDPVYYEVMPSGEAGNRRAEIYLDS